jgi:transcriptional regulator with XRE-family HTH domain
MQFKAADPSALRMILSHNLQALTADIANHSEMCRQIGVNRTQFNRYLAGSAFPRPDVLYRICRFFNVDANILLEPLADRRKPQTDALTALPPQHRPFDHYLLPDGIYRYWRKSFRQPEKAYQGMALIVTTEEGKLWKGYDIHSQPMREGSARHARSTKYQGRLIQQFDGFTLLSRTPYNDMMNLTYFEYGLDSMPEYYSGLTFVTQRRLPEANRLSAIVMRRLNDSCGARLACARHCGTMPFDAVPEPVRKALRRVPDGL